MVKRSILVPAIGDPYLLGLWFDKARYFIDEVDEVVVGIDKKSDDPLITELNHRLLEWLNAMPKVRAFISKEAGMVRTFENVMAECRGEYFAIIQEDAYVFKAGEVDRHFAIVESGLADVVGTPMYCYSAELIEVISDYANNYEREMLNTRGYSLWQNFLFAKYSDYLSTNQKIAPQSWPPNIEVPFLQWKPEKAVVLDMFASIVFQWRVQGKRFYYVDQFLSANIEHWEWFNAPNFWIHVNALGTVLTEMISPSNPTEITINHQLTKEYERRMAWWRYAMLGGPYWLVTWNEFRDKYLAILERFDKNYKTNPARILNRIDGISRLMGGRYA